MKPNDKTTKMAGLMAKAKIPMGEYSMVYKIPDKVSYSKPLITILNTGDSPVSIKFFSTTPKILIDQSKKDTIEPDQIIIDIDDTHYFIVNKEDYLEYGVSIAPGAVLERWFVAFDGGECLYFTADAVGCIVRITGVENSLIG